MILSGFIMNMSYAQNVSSFFKDFANKDISKISSKFSEEMEVCVNNTQDFMSKAEAKAAIQKFLIDVGPISGSELHQGSSKTKASQYRVGQLKTSKGNFRVFIYLEGTEANYKIVGVLFNPE